MKKRLKIAAVIAFVLAAILCLNGFMKPEQTYTYSDTVSETNLNVNAEKGWNEVYKIWKFDAKVKADNNIAFVNLLNSTKNKKFDVKKPFILTTEVHYLVTINNFKKTKKKIKHVYTFQNDCGC